MSKRRDTMKFGLDVSTAGKYSDPKTLVELAFEAERAGWDGFFLWDAVFAIPKGLPMADPWMTLSAIAVRTKHIKIGAMVTPIARRHPYKVARETITLDHLSGGRLIFGVGLGYHALDFEAFGLEADPRIRGEKLDEGLEILTGLWRGKSFSFHGKHYTINDVKFLPRPCQKPRIPVWVAGYWPNRRPFRRAARYEGVLPGKASSHFTPKDLKEVLAYLRGFRVESTPFEVAV